MARVDDAYVVLAVDVVDVAVISLHLAPHAVGLAIAYLGAHVVACLAKYRVNLGHELVERRALLFALFA